MNENTIATNFEPQGCVIFVQSTKIGTHENKAIHSMHDCTVWFNFSIDLAIYFQEKEKELQIKNIYANRARAQHRLPASYGGTPHDTPPPKPRKRAPSLHDLTPREKVKMFEERRREEERKLREVSIERQLFIVIKWCTFI